MAIKLFGDVMSAMSGETKEEKNVRTNRVGSPHIPFTNIPLSIQTPWGEVNASRWMGVFTNTPVGGDSAVNNLSKYSPIQNPLNKKNYGSDVMVGPLISSLMDTDFRGKSIQDPSQSKFKPSTLTPGEKALNVGNYLQRSYMPPIANDVVDAVGAARGKEDFYGRTRSLPQAAMRLAGIKVEQYGPEEVRKQQERDAEFEQYKRDDAKKLLNSISKDYQTGKIDYQTYQSRIQNIQKDLTLPSQSEKILQNYSGDYSYIDDSGDRKTVKTRKQAETAVNRIELKDELSSGNLDAIDQYPKGTLTQGIVDDLYENGDIDYATKAKLTTRITREEKSDKLNYIRESLQANDAETNRELYNTGQITNSTVDDLFESGLMDGKTAYKYQLWLFKKDVESGKRLPPKTGRTYMDYKRKYYAKYSKGYQQQPTQPQPIPQTKGQPFFRSAQDRLLGK
jgi:hypothetical protein